MPHPHRTKGPINKHKVHVVMSEFKRGTLKSGSGHKVTSRAQAVAIALSEGRRAAKKKKH